MNLLDHRALTRVDCFRLKINQGFEPVWHFSRDGLDQSEALIMDISPTGCCLIVSKNLHLDDYLDIEISIEQCGATLNTRIETRWQDLGYSVVRKRVGLKFINPTKHFESQLKNVIGIANDKEYGFLVGQVNTRS